jgi:hypothetical protein
MEKYIVWNRNGVLRVFEGKLNLDSALNLAEKHNSLVTEFNSSLPAYFKVEGNILIVEQTYRIGEITDEPVKEITAEWFEEIVGNSPIQDDLERCNCKSAGQVGHSDCGWNFTRNYPNFLVKPSEFN